jgi:hypothetical protein
MLNPYREFQKLRPSASIEDGVLVYDGTFSLPLASAMSHVEASGTLLKQKQSAEAFAEAKTAVAIDPTALQTQLALGDALAALGQKVEAREAYARGLAIARTMEPTAREIWIPNVQKRLDGV